MSYVIPRRFSEFHELYNMMKARNIRFDNFPKKTIFSINSQAKLEKRKEILNEFLRFLLQKSECREIPEFFQFIEFEENQV